MSTNDGKNDNTSDTRPVDGVVKYPAVKAAQSRALQRDPRSVVSASQTGPAHRLLVFSGQHERASPDGRWRRGILDPRSARCLPREGRWYGR